MKISENRQPQDKSWRQLSHIWVPDHKGIQDNAAAEEQASESSGPAIDTRTRALIRRIIPDPPPNSPQTDMVYGWKTTKPPQT